MLYTKTNSYNKLEQMFAFIIIVGAMFFLLVRKEKEWLSEVEEKKRRQLEQEEKEKKKAEEERQKKQLQRELEDKYAASELTREIIRAICDDSGHKPEEITIYDDRISGCTNGAVRTYSFRANRVPFLQPVTKYSDESINEKELLRPQVAIATAMSRIMGGEYDVIDMAKRDCERRPLGEGFYYTQYQYKSDYVILRLKPTKSF